MADDMPRRLSDESPQMTTRRTGTAVPVKCQAPGCGATIQTPIMYVVEGKPWCAPCLHRAYP